MARPPVAPNRWSIGLFLASSVGSGVIGLVAGFRLGASSALGSAVAGVLPGLTTVWFSGKNWDGNEAMTWCVLAC